MRTHSFAWINPRNLRRRFIDKVYMISKSDLIERVEVIHSIWETSLLSKHLSISWLQFEPSFFSSRSSQTATHCFEGLCCQIEQIWFEKYPFFSSIKRYPLVLIFSDLSLFNLGLSYHRAQTLSQMNTNLQYFFYMNSYQNTNLFHLNRLVKL